MLQVILRPRPSTSGRSRQQRLFLRFHTISLRRLSGPSLPPEGAGDRNMDAVGFGRKKTSCKFL